MSVLRRLPRDLQHFQKGRICGLENKALGPDNNVVWYNTQFKPIKYAGKIVATTLISTDITEKKRIEEELRKKHEELQQFKEFTVGRELKMVDLKKEVNELLGKLGRKPKYNTSRVK